MSFGICSMDTTGKAQETPFRRPFRKSKTRPWRNVHGAVVECLAVRKTMNLSLAISSSIPFTLEFRQTKIRVTWQMPSITTLTIWPVRQEAMLQERQSPQLRRDAHQEPCPVRKS